MRILSIFPNSGGVAAFFIAIKQGIIMYHPIRFRLSVLSLALLAASSQAQEATLLEPITIKSDGTGNPHRAGERLAGACT